MTLICISKKFTNFALADRYAEARSGFERRDADIIKAFTRRSFLAFQESGKFIGMVKNVATVDALWICIFIICQYGSTG